MYWRYFILNYIGCIITGKQSSNNQAATDALNSAKTLYNELNSLTCTYSIGINIPSNTVFTPGVYCSSQAINYLGNVIFQGTSNFIFVTQQSISFSSGSFIFQNNASGCDLFFVSAQTISTGTMGVVNGTLIANAGINLQAGTVMGGNAYSLTSIVNPSGNIFYVCNSTICISTLPTGNTATFAPCCWLNVTLGYKQCFNVTSANCAAMNGTYFANATSCSTVCLSSIIPSLCVVNYNNGTCGYGVSVTNNNAPISSTQTTAFFSSLPLNTYLPNTTYITGYNAFVSNFNTNCSLNYSFTIIINNISSSVINSNNTYCNATCCSAANQTCSITPSNSCINSNGTFAFLTTCNSSLCQLPIDLVRYCFKNDSGCTTYFSCISSNKIPITIASTSNNYVTQGVTNLGNIGQPTTIQPGTTSLCWNITSSSCLQYTWTINAGVSN